MDKNQKEYFDGIGLPSELFCASKTVSGLKKGDIIFYFSNKFTDYLGVRHCICGVFNCFKRKRMMMIKVLWSDMNGWKELWPDKVPFSKSSGYIGGLGDTFELRDKKHLNKILVLLNL